jgi:hypothetical protein
MMDEESSRLDAEWLVTSATRDVMLLAMKDQMRASYKRSAEVAGVLCPSLMGKDVSLLRKAMESEVVKEYRQRAEAKTRIC